MSGSKRRREQLNPGLLPFMAVLLCTMGALVLILILMVSNAQASAKKKIEEHRDKIVETVEDIEFISRELDSGRKKQQEEIANQRQHLAHYEDHINRLNEELEALQRTANTLSAPGSLTENQSSKKDRLEEIKKAIAEAETRLEEEKKRLANTKPAFAIFPYKGPNGTNRRPIYLECVSEGVRIQPEGVLIPLSSLRPPLGPGNPLDASLRLIRNAYQQASASSSQSISPYPLLLIRPDGIKTYSLARAAMGGWDDQFGYELVDAQMPLAFPPSTPGLSEALRRTIDLASQRQEALAAAMPSRYRDQANWDDFNPDSDGAPKEEGSVAVRVVPEGEKWEVIQELPPGVRIREGTANNSRAPNAGAGGPSPTGPSSANSTNPNMQSNSPNGTSNGLTGIGNPALSQGLSGGQWSMGSRSNNTASSDPPSFSGGNAEGGTWGGSDNGPGPYLSGQEGTDATSGQGDGSNVAGGSSSSGSGGGPAGHGAAASSSSNGGSAMQPIFLQSETENQFGRDPAANGNPPSNLSLGYQDRPPVEYREPNAAASSNSNSNNSDRNTRPSSKSRDTGDKPISVTQGRGWAQSRALGKATPVVREIRMIVLADRWLLVSDSQQGQVEATILLDQGPSAASTQLARLIRERIASWGVAVSGGYWKAKLVAETYSDADVSRQRLEKLLEGSGLEIAIKNLDASQRR